MKPVFVQTQNVRNFMAFMAVIERRRGHDSFGAVWGRAGRGKTRTAKHYAAQHGCVFIEAIRGWSELWMYQDMLQAFGVQEPPLRKKACFELLIEQINDSGKIMFLDEADLIGPRLLESVRDICKIALSPIVLIGEEGLPVLLGKDRRVWSRQSAVLEFQPLSAADIVTLTEEATDDGLTMNAATADFVQRRTGGDIRLIEQILVNVEPVCRTTGKKEITEEIVRKALSRTGFDRKLAA